MPTVAVLHHLSRSALGHAEMVRTAGVDLDERVLSHGAELPVPAELDGLLVLGGDQSAVGAGEDPLLEREAALLRELVAAGVPVLGICLGGQMIAHALGAEVRHVGRTVEWRALRKLPAAHEDPLFGPLEDPVPALHWNEDVFELPDGAEPLLEPGPAGVEAFRAGSAWAVQYHPDVDDAVLADWMDEYGAQVPDAGALRAVSAERRDAQQRASAILFEGFARIVRDRAA